MSEIWSHELNRYVEEFPETNEVENFTVTYPRTAMRLIDLPTSPKSLLKALMAAGWETRAWLTIGEIAPTLYLSDSADEGENSHVKGDIRFDGYTASMYVIEGRAAFNLPLGMQAHYVGKNYGEGDKRNKPGSFSHARLADPVGVVQELGFDYQPIKVTRGKDQAGRIVETPASFAKNQLLMKQMAERLDRDHNDGAFILNHRPTLTASTKATDWLAEWASYGKLANV